MSTFAVQIKRIKEIETHPNADAIEIAVIDGYRSVIRKNQFKKGDLVAYIPEQSVLPQWLLERLSLWDTEKQKGTLGGTKGNRLRAVRLRGELSQGICYPVEHSIVHGKSRDDFSEVKEGDDVTELLGIEKYEPPVPVYMAGEIMNSGFDFSIAFDVENWKSHTDVLKEGEEVVFTEKLHGTCTIIAVLPGHHAHPEAFGENKNILVSSKGLFAKGLSLKNNEINQRNIYVRATREIIKRMEIISFQSGMPLFIFGETFGPGVQDLTYENEVGFRIFAVAKGRRGGGKQSYLDWEGVEAMAKFLAIETVPVLYKGPFSVEKMHEHTSGKTQLSANHIREGIVMVPATERNQQPLGRVCLKSVSPEYLTRKGGTEYN